MKKEVHKLLLLFCLSFLASYLLIFDTFSQEKKTKEEVKKVKENTIKEEENTIKEEEDANKVEVEEENSHIRKFSEKLVVGIFLDTSQYQYDVIRGENELIITPNTPVRTNIAVSYKFLRFQYGLSNLFNDVEAYEFGKTKDFNIKLNIFIKSFRQIISYHSIQGMYLENMEDFDEDYIEGQPRTQFNDMFRYSFVGQSSYNFNPNYSHKSIDLHNEWQKKSAFSFTPYLIYNYSKITNLPQNLPISLPISVQNLDLNFQPRAYANLVIKEKIFFMGMIYPDIGYRYSISQEKDAKSGVISNQYKNIILFGSGLRVQLGFNSTYFYTGTTLAFNLQLSDEYNIFLVESNQFVSLYVGFRFTAPGFLRNAIKKAKLMIDLQ